MTGGLSTILKNSYLNTVSFAQMFRDSVDIFKTTYMSSFKWSALVSFIENLVLLILSENFLRLLVFTRFKKPFIHYLCYLNPFLTTLPLSWRPILMVFYFCVL